MNRKFWSVSTYAEVKGSLRKVAMGAWVFATSKCIQDGFLLFVQFRLELKLEMELKLKLEMELGL